MTVLDAEVIVLGAGVAGTAAAHVLTRAGKRVHVVHASAGATSLWNGLVDGLTGDVSAEEKELLGVLGLTFARPRPRVINMFGMPRTAVAHDSAILDLEACRPKLIVVPTLPRPSWDGRAVSAMLETYAKGDFDVRTVAAPKLLSPGELSAPDGTVALGLDDEARFTAFSAELESLMERWRNTATALLLPPWLGVSLARAPRLADTLALSVGEVSCGLAGAAGMRFAVRRDLHFAKLGVTVTRGRCSAVSAAESGISLELSDGTSLRGTALVVASGGFVSGAMEMPRSPAVSDVPVAQRSVPSLSFQAPFLRAGSGGSEVRANGSVFGTTPEDLIHTMRSPSLLDALGILTGDRCSPLGAEGLRVTVAGDAVADAPRTFGAALRSGIRAAQALLQR